MLFLLWITALRPYFPYLEYQLRREYITAQFCINLDRPTLNCKGSCHLQQRLKEAAAQERLGVPSNGLPKAESTIEFSIPQAEPGVAPLLAPWHPSVHPRADKFPTSRNVEIEGPPPQRC